MSVFKEFPGLENRDKLFQDYQGPTRALNITKIPSHGESHMVMVWRATLNFTRGMSPGASYAGVIRRR